MTKDLLHPLKSEASLFKGTGVTNDLQAFSFHNERKKMISNMMDKHFHRDQKHNIKKQMTPCF